MSRLSLNFYRESHKLIAWLERTVLHNRVDIAIGNSLAILDELEAEGVNRGRLRLLHNGIDPAPFAHSDGDRALARAELGIAQDAFTIVAVGNLHAYKGHGDLIEACAIAANRLPRGWKLLIAGRDEGGNYSRFQALIAVKGLEEHASLLGACDNVREVLFAADVFVQPSHHEGLPNAIIEAMASSLPVVATTVGGIPEAVTGQAAGHRVSGETGWLVPPREPAALAEALIAASEDPDRRHRMGERARERVVAEFSLEKSVATYEAIYRELVP
jgi:glycosyltransferase involved in cell wall biosynthesis